MVRDLDLNELPSPLNNMGHPIDLTLSIGLPWESGLLQIQMTGGLESVDDDVVICSPRSFAEAREKARRSREVIEVIDADGDSRSDCSDSAARSFPGNNNQHRRGPAKAAKRTIVNPAHCVNLESHDKTKSNDLADAPGKSLSLLLPKVPSFRCPVCLGPFVEETSTKCGHVFCRRCIDAAIASQSKCPACRRKLKGKDTFRIYLPTSD